MKYKKTGRGSLRFKGKIIKPGQIFDAEPQEIPEAFNDTITPLEDIPEEEAVEVKESVYKLSHRSGPWWDVIDSNDNVMNDKALSRENALKLIKSFE